MRYLPFIFTFLLTTSVLADDYWFIDPIVQKKAPIVRPQAPAPVPVYSPYPAKLNKRSVIKKNREIVQLPSSKSAVYKKVNAERPGPSLGTIDAMYSRLGISSIWTSAFGRLNAKGESFLSYLNTISKHGLNSSEYYLSEINTALAGGTGADKLISRALVKLANHATLGRLISKKADPDWHIAQSGINQENILKTASSNGNIGSYVEGLFPQTSVYQNLAVALERQVKKGGWSQFPAAGPKLQIGSSHQHVPLLRQRLADSGYVSGGSGNTFDASLSSGLTRFQKDHGLNGDGVLGRITRLTLAKSTTERSKQIVSTLERLRWLPSNLGSRYIVVNTAGYQLNLIENERTTLNMRVVVGKKRRGDKNHETPSFSKSMRYVVLNPRWYVPPSIASKELLLLAQKDRNYFKNKGYKVYDSKGEVSSSKVNWNKYSKGEKLPLQIVQNAGDGNALGKIKFMLPNKYNIYLHDTPQKSLFARDRRAFSHGCVRLARPMDLATKILGKSEVEISQMISTGRNQRVNLAKNIPVYIGYFTAWVRDDGTVTFFDDYFDRDSRMQHNFS